MPKLKRLSGPEVVAIFQKFGFVRLTQRGSHIKLRRINARGEKQTLIVPNHQQIDTGTLRAILRPWRPPVITAASNRQLANNRDPTWSTEPLGLFLQSACCTAS